MNCSVFSVHILRLPFRCMYIVLRSSCVSFVTLCMFSCWAIGFHCYSVCFFFHKCAHIQAHCSCVCFTRREKESFNFFACERDPWVYRLENPILCRYCTGFSSCAEFTFCLYSFRTGEKLRRSTETGSCPTPASSSCSTPSPSPSSTTSHSTYQVSRIDMK